MEVISKLYHDKYETNPMIGVSLKAINAYLSDALDIILPGMSRKHFKSEDDLKLFVENHLVELKNILIKFVGNKNKVEQIASEYFVILAQISKFVASDAHALLDGDPAAKSLCEIVLSYPGLYAIATYRVAHFFWRLNVPIFPRMLAENAHNKTGIDIHPGAKIGESFFIDHGTGVVIGETAVIGNRVKIYQGVTLGALSVDKNLENVKRHPTIMDDCIIYSHATILGGDTIVGCGTIIGGNVWLTKSVPECSIIYHRSEIRLDKKKGFNQEEELTYEI
jgi:serine O-acetyltransferase